MLIAQPLVKQFWLAMAMLMAILMSILPLRFVMARALALWGST